MYKENTPIDFVITWVDGSDVEWLEEKKKYNTNIDVDDSLARYRDFGTLKYLLRSIDKFAPWVRNIFLVTNGQVPSWLSLENPKLRLVKHSDFIPEEYLPTFSSHPIEWNIHRIEGLSENFVYFNDDMILTNHVKPNDFFENDLPCDTFGLGMVRPIEYFSHIPFNSMLVLNSHFDFKQTMRKHKNKFFSFKYGARMLKTCVLSIQNVFYGMYDPHIAISFKKSYFDLVWQEEYDLIDKTCRNKFRSKEDVSIWLVRYWQLLTGSFSPRSYKFGRYYSIYDFIKANQNRQKEYKCREKIICINDSNVEDAPFENSAMIFESIMNKKFYEKSQYEK